jgi:hypothetical protein
MIERRNRLVSGARVQGDLIPGCAVVVTPSPADGSIVVIPPSEGESFGKAIIKNTSDHLVNRPGIDWKIK